MKLKLPLLLLAATTFAHPTPWGTEHHPPLPLQTLPATYTITIYAPHNRQLNGLKIESVPTSSGLAIYQNQSMSYCPTGEESLCPNGTELAFTNSSPLLPNSIVPGGQNVYVNTSGELEITVQHEHSIPTGAYWAYGGGFNWTGLPVLESCPNDDKWRWAHEGFWGWANKWRCPTDNVDYNCAYPSGYWTWTAPGMTEGGLYVCDDPVFDGVRVVFGRTPAFGGCNCVDIEGLGTHEYTGEAVYAYF